MIEIGQVKSYSQGEDVDASLDDWFAMYDIFPFVDEVLGGLYILLAPLFALAWHGTNLAIFCAVVEKCIDHLTSAI